jgi:hypothetical protein
MSWMAHLQKSCSCQIPTPLGSAKTAAAPRTRPEKPGPQRQAELCGTAAGCNHGQLRDADAQHLSLATQDALFPSCTVLAGTA